MLTVQDLQRELDECRKTMLKKDRMVTGMINAVRRAANETAGLCYLSLESNLDGTQHEQLEKIILSAEKAVRIIDDMFDFANIEAGTLSLEFVPATLQAIFENVHNSVYDKAVKKGIDLVIDIAPKLHSPIICDPRRMMQIFVKLANKAVQSISGGEVRITVELEEEKKRELTVRFLLKISGNGVSHEDHEHLFKALNQTDSPLQSSIDRRADFDIALVHQLVSLMGGEVKVTGGSGCGTSLAFSLVLAKSTGGNPAESEVVTDAANDDLLRGARILLVEDDFINQEVSAAILRRKGIVVDIANNGQQALDMLEEKEFDCVLMDIQMPVVDGYEATRRIRSNYRFRDLPILAMSANNSARDVERSIAGGMNGHLSKPVAAAQLYKELGRWISGSVSKKTGKKEDGGASITSEHNENMSGWEWIDVSYVLDRIGDKPLFLKLLKVFKEQHGDDDVRIKKCIEQNDLKGVRAILHSLKGVTPVIGAILLANSVNKLDQLLLTDPPDSRFHAMFDEISFRLGATITAAAEILEKEDAGKICEPDPGVPLFCEEVGKDKPRILVVDDEQINITMLEDIIGDSCEVVCAMEPDQAFAYACQIPRPSLIFLDVNLPSMNGFELCRQLKQDKRSRDIPVIFITARDDEKDEIEGFRAGAVDYIFKPVRRAVVKARLQLHLELKRERDFHARRSLIDGLTEIPNRIRLMEYLDQELRRAKRNGGWLSVIMLDIDFFKNYNDNYGHLAGDEILKKVARVVDDELQRGNDLVGRYGGEEFVCVLPEVDRNGIEDVCKKILTRVRSLGVPHEHSSVADILTISLGAVSLVPGVETSVKDLLYCADQAMYKAKENGRNGFACY